MKPYGPAVWVDKVECRNHILRNMDKHFRNLLCQTSYPLERRNELKANLHRFRIAVVGAMKYNKAKGTAADLANDFLNVPFHIFGSHVNCR